MRKAIVNSITDVMVRKGIIDSSDRELYCFGINQLFLFLINAGTSIAIGIMAGMVIESIVFSAAYIPLRKFAGGYHASTAGRCYLLSIILIVCALLIIKLINFSTTETVIILLVAIVIILTKAPVESINKPLSTAERAVFRKTTIKIMFLEVILVLVFSKTVMTITECIIVAVAFSALMLVLPNRQV